MKTSKKSHKSKDQKYEAISRNTLHVSVSIHGLNQGLASDMDEMKLYKIFSHFKYEIKEAVIFSTNELKRVGRITFNLALSASDAMETLQNKELPDGSILNLRYWNPGDEVLPLEACFGFEGCENASISSKRKQKKEAMLKSEAIVIDDEDVSMTYPLIEDLASLNKKGAVSSTSRKEATFCSPNRETAFGLPEKGKKDGPTPIVPKKVSKAIPKPEMSSRTFEEKVCKQIVLTSLYEPICTSPEMVKYNKFLESHFKTMSSCEVVQSASALPNQAFLCLQPNCIIHLKVIAGALKSEKADAIVVRTESSTIEDYTFDGTSSKIIQTGETTVLRPQSPSHSFVIQVVLPLSKQKDNSCCNKAVRNCLSDAIKMHLGSIAFPGLAPEMIKSLIAFLCEVDPVNLHTVSIVLETDSETEAYKQALSCLMSRKGNESATPCVQSNSQAPRSNAVWTWRHDDGSLVPYSPAIMDLLNEEYENGSDCTSFSIGTAMYSIDFTWLKQVNLETNREREVLQIPSIGDCRVVWEYFDDSGYFVSYSDTDAALIENLFQQRDESTSLVIQKRAYRFDFTAMKQINVTTGFERSITRHLNEKPAREPVFLSNGEVVVNITSPSHEKLDAAKIALEKKLHSFLFTKTIPYPANSKNSLLSELQAVAKKHKIDCELGTQIGSKGCPSKQVLKLQGLRASVEKALLKIQEKILSSLFKSGEVEYPQEWEVMSENEQVSFVELSPLCKEYERVYKRFHQTMNFVDFSIKKIHRVQNKHLWTRYQQSKARLQDKQSQVNEKELFHGTRTNPASTICSSEEGFDMRYSREGMWGCANYFAMKASYSDNYSYCDQTAGTCEMILAKVLTGDSFSCESDPSLRMPPLKSQAGQSEAGKLQQVRYDSVNGVTHRCKVFMTYSNDLAYPAFIITYRCENVTILQQLQTLPSVQPAAPVLQPSAKPTPSRQIPQTHSSMLPTASVLSPSTKPTSSRQIPQQLQTQSSVQPAVGSVLSPSQPSAKPTSSRQIRQPLQTQSSAQPAASVLSPSQPSARPSSSQHPTTQPSVQPAASVLSLSQPSATSHTPTLTQTAKRKFSPDKSQPPSPPVKRAHEMCIIA